MQEHATTEEGRGLAVDWEAFADLARKNDIENDAAFARLARVNQSVVSRARSGVVGPAFVAALVRVFPSAGMGLLLQARGVHGKPR